MMFELNVHNKREDMLCYYASAMHRSQAIKAGGFGLARMASVVYDYTTSSFIKHRSGNTELMNKMLDVQRARMEGLITPEMERLVNAHA